jgi:hypothetical protein
MAIDPHSLVRLGPPATSYLFPRLNSRHFDTIDVMDAESQALLNTSTPGCI